jgi:hypothetical protein
VRPPAEGYRTQSDDTSPEIERLMVERWRSMSPEDKLAEIDDACRGSDEVAMMGIRSRHPDADEGEVRLRLAALRLDPALVVDAFGWDPVERGR